MSHQTRVRPTVAKASSSHTPPPTLPAAKAVLNDIDFLLHPPRPNGRKGRKPFKGDDLLRDRMVMMQSLFWCYIPMPLPGWTKASDNVAHINRGGPYLARKLCAWCQAFITDRHDLPFNTFGVWNPSILDVNDELKEELEAHLQGIGKFVCAANIVQYMARAEVQAQFGLEKGICLSTAHAWMRTLEYQWMRAPRGQFIDGHEREDVMTYRQDSFLPKMLRHEVSLRQWKADGMEELRTSGATAESIGLAIALLQFTVWWFGDQSSFYAHDRRDVRWVKTMEKLQPRPKGDGASLMVGDFVSADYGFLQSKDGSSAARTLFKAGKNHDGYFQSTDVLTQLTMAMDILDKDYPDDKHVFIIDNAPTHLKRADDALSARKMPKGPSKKLAVLANVIGEDGKVVHGPDGKILKHKIRMGDGRFSDGCPQALYFPDGHERAGDFKGMAVILKERGYVDVDSLRAECKDFKCPPHVERCCCRWLLHNEPDFQEVKSLVETHCKSRGYEIVFLPRFHCELNPIEQCWGFTKRKYREYPPSSLEADLERNVVSALSTIMIELIRRIAAPVPLTRTQTGRFFICTQRFMDAYRKGLTGKQALWATKKYHGHRVLPESILAELDEQDHDTS
ncbi:hypothetical protein DAEQUDRAFT_733158 [Daedalea quercina L-15889]|uniref:Tc1-like transposase DDE domain-containing protein n=1 Tax=Daedalea quercina L-15889 TaxID=1314783 RepID=A0A165L6Q1_9APHY|nr:hypothetical protein DAEQUDRAFT_733158 [Daedalea quercina L-15889]